MLAQHRTGVVDLFQQHIVGQFDLTPAEAGELTKMVQALARVIETVELEERVRKLEEAVHK